MRKDENGKSDPLADAMRDDVPGTEPRESASDAVERAAQTTNVKRNPDVGQPASPTAVRDDRVLAGPKTVAKTVIPGSELVPDLDAQRAQTVQEYVFWVGVTPSCPAEHIDVAGINFPKLNERIMARPGQKGKYQRVPVIGALVMLTEDKVRKMRERLPRTVVRFLDKQTQESEVKAAEAREAGQNMGDLIVRPRKGYLITIPTEEEAKTRHAPKYIARKGDEPAARYMFAVLCADQERPTRGEFYPDVLEDTGLSWPEELTQE